jgi:hypothetical protein
MEQTTNLADAFINRWKGADGSELANAQSFTRELCELLGVGVPEPARADTRDNAYVFERRVIFNHADGSSSEGRIDCYHRGAFVLESKKLKQGEHTKGFGVAMLGAYKQAEQYVRALPAHEGRPPFLLVVDVGNVIEIYAEFSCSGGTYTPFPDPSSHRVKLDHLRDEKIRDRLKKIWLDPQTLDPAKQSAKVTREIAAQLAEIAKSLESAKYDAERVGAFLTRCLFTFFAEDVGLLPTRAFTELLQTLAKSPTQFVPMLTELWQAMDTGRFSVALRTDVLHFNGKLFKNPDVLPLNRDQIDLLVTAGSKDWSQVEPAIFGTLLERALTPTERHSLGAHYTPRSYVERLVLPTVIEPLREEWSTVQTAALTLASEGNMKAAENVVRTFQLRLCNLRILDPACGSGNFLYVTLEHLKRLEGEVLNQLQDFNVSMSLETEGLTVDPHQFLGIELNPRAASIAEMVLWIGYLQWDFKTKGAVQPPQPVLRDFKNIECRDAVLAYDSVEILCDEHGKPVTRWDGKSFKKHPVTGEDVPDEAAQIATQKYINPRKAEWPQADFVVGNPPFIGDKRLRLSVGDGYVDALRKTWNDVPDSAEFVMYWWRKAALLIETNELQRFGFITTNSIKQTFNRRVIEPHLASGLLSLSFAIPDHPWVDNADGAAVRIAMTVCTAGVFEGRLLSLAEELPTGDDYVEVKLSERKGLLFADLRIGANVASAKALIANRNMSGNGVMLAGSGFIIDKNKANSFGYGESSEIKQYRNGKDLTAKSRDAYIIDFFGLTMEEARTKNPAAFQWLLEHVKPERDHNNRPKIKNIWWIFGEPRRLLRSALKGLPRYIATVETTKHRVFQFLSSGILPDHMLIAIASSDAYHLGVFSSLVHATWSLVAGGRLGVGNDPRYNKSRCFEPFPYPLANEKQKQKIRTLAEQLDAHRKNQQAKHPELTLTGMYNVLEKLKSGEVLNAKDKIMHEQGLVSVLRQLHHELDLAVLDAYGWNDLAALMNVVNGTPPAKDKTRDELARELEEALLEKLVALNSQRAEEEKKGIIHWLRPEYQHPQSLGTATQNNATQTEMDVVLEADGETDLEVTNSTSIVKQAWPKDDIAQVKAIIDLLSSTKHPMALDTIATYFSGKGQWKKRLPNILEMLVVVGKARVDGDKFAGC